MRYKSNYRINRLPVCRVRGARRALYPVGLHPASQTLAKEARGGRLLEPRRALEQEVCCYSSLQNQ